MTVMVAVNRVRDGRTVRHHDAGTRRRCRALSVVGVRLACALLSSLPQAHALADPLLPAAAYDTVLNGRIAVVPDFLPLASVAALRSDAKALHEQGFFTTDALAAYGSKGDFDPSRDRTVLKLKEWQRSDIGNTKLRHDDFAAVMAKLRTDLAVHLGRPGLDTGLSTTKYGRGSTEISYTRFGPGAYLKRHLDEHHEELKGKRGWEKPTRRSVSWLVYLNEPDWDVERHGGCLRCFQRDVRPSLPVGATHHGDLQIGWFQGNRHTPDVPVFLDATRPGRHGYCALYVLRPHSGNDETKLFVSRTFHPDPVLFLSGGDAYVRQFLLDDPASAPRFRFLEPPKSALTSLLARGVPPVPSAPEPDESAYDVPPYGGTLVLFDSVSLPHEVLAATGRERWATSGWFHEDQQEEVYHHHD